MTKKIGIIKSDKYFLHKCQKKKLESPERLFVIYDYVQNNSDDFIFYEPEMVDNILLERVHSKFYVNQIEQYSKQNYDSNYDKDTYIDKDTFTTAKLAVGGCQKLADKIMNNEIDKGFALIRPPGHHAEIGRAMGFCIFNNIALTAKYLIDEYGLERILIVDFDAHHGNGTQEIFYENSNVLTLSIHQNNIFPFSGKGEEIGEGKGEGFNINIPVHPYFGDTEYSYIFGKIIQQVTENYLPQIILVSAGYDGHINDTASNLEITDNGYKNITKSLIYLANKYSEGKLLYILEGGYNTEALTSAVISTLETLNKDILNPPGFMFSERVDKVIKKDIPHNIKSMWNI